MDFNQSLAELEERVVALEAAEQIVKIPYISFAEKEGKELILPRRNKVGDVGYDAYAHEDVIIQPHSSAKISLGIGVVLPTGFAMACRTRGGNHLKGLICGPAWVDWNYRGVINALLYNVSDEPIEVKIGDRPCSIDIYKTYAIEWQDVNEYLEEFGISEEELMNTNRGATGFGASGN